MPEWGESYSGPGMRGIRNLDTRMPTPGGGPTRISPIAKQSLMGDEPFVSIGESVLADDLQCDRNIPTGSKCQTDHGARRPLSNRCRKEVRNGFTPASSVRLLQPIMREPYKGYAARLCLTTCRERCLSFICSVETTLRPRSASCASSRWIACRRSCLRP